MPKPRFIVEKATTESNLDPWIVSYRRHCLAENHAPDSLRVNLGQLRRFGDYLVAKGMPTDPTAISREHIETFITELLQTRKAKTAINYYRALHAFFNWLVAEDELKASPMARMHMPKEPEAPPPILTDAELRKLLKACEGRDFYARRDMALIRLFIDTGCRLREIVRLAVTDVDLDEGIIQVMGKGSRIRNVPFSPRTAQAIDRYLRLRAGHRLKELPALWLTRMGAMKDNSFYTILRSRGKAAGIGEIHPHLLRHTFAHVWLAGGGQEGDLMRLAGWRNRQMLSRYGASAADQRAREAYKRMNPGGRL